MSLISDVSRCAEMAQRLYTAARGKTPLETILRVVIRLYRLGWIYSGVRDVIDAVSEFQAFAGVKVDGDVGPQTVAALFAPRCGCPDIPRESTPEHADYLRLQSRVRVLQSQWRKRSLRYYIGSYVPGIPPAAQREILSAAWRSWTDVCGIEVGPTDNPREADVHISTGRGNRHDFDGPGGTLAWAYLPPGDDSQLLMRFDIDEQWKEHPNGGGVWLEPVACHEFGHLLGLDHSFVQTALMAPYYNPSVWQPQQNDDVSRVRVLYGTPAPAPLPDPVPSPQPSVVRLLIDSDLPAGEYRLERVN